MKRALFVCALGIFAALVALPAHADTTYTLDFSGCFGSTYHGNCYGTSFSSNNVTFTVAGTPTTPTSGIFPNSYGIDAISGGMTIGGDSYTIGTTPATGLGGDNELDLYSNGLLDFDPAGLDFTLSSTSGEYDEFRIFGPVPGAEGQYSVTFDDCTYKHGKRTCTPETYQAQDLTFSINGQIVEVPSAPPSSTPEPGSLALLGTAILGGAGALRRRFRA